MDVRRHGVQNIYRFTSCSSKYLENIYSYSSLCLHQNWHVVYIIIDFYLFWSILVPAARFDWFIPLVWSRLLFYFSHRFNLYLPISFYTYLVIFSTLPKLYFSSTCRSIRPFHLPYTLSLTLSDRIRFRINRSKKKKENFVAAKHVLWNIHEDLTKERFQRNEGEMVSRYPNL